MSEETVSKDGWTEELMNANSWMRCEECGHPVGEHIYPGYHGALCCDVDYCECQGLHTYEPPSRLRPES